jgi:transposase-like protein
MVYVSLCCRSCGSDAVCKNGHSNGKQRYLCRDSQCLRKTFYANYTYNGCKPDVKISILQWSVDGAGIRVISRCLAVSPVTVLSELKKEASLNSINPEYFQRHSHIKIRMVGCRH